MPRQRKPTKQRLTRVEVEADLRDEIDWDRFAWALLQYCRLKIEGGKGEGKAP
jgi:hypothetical protein